jgi:hypothetical protein
VSAELYAIIALSVAIGAFVQGTIGVGFALVSVPVIAFFDRDILPVCVLALMIPLNIYVIWREHGSIDWPGASWITVGRIFGTAGGLVVLSLLVPALLNGLIGVVTIAAAAATLFMPHFKPGRWTLLTAGVITGITETATGVGGPPLALVYQHQPGAVLRATIATCFVVGQVLSLVVLTAAGRAGTSQWTAALVLFPALALGGFASRHAHKRFSGPWLRLSVLVFAIASGFGLLLWR